MIKGNLKKVTFIPYNCLDQDADLKIPNKIQSSLFDPRPVYNNPVPAYIFQGHYMATSRRALMRVLCGLTHTLISTHLWPR